MIGKYSLSTIQNIMENDYSLSVLLADTHTDAQNYFLLTIKNLVEITTATENFDDSIPLGFALRQNHTNPFNPTITTETAIHKNRTDQLNAVDSISQIVSKWVHVN